MQTLREQLKNINLDIQADEVWKKEARQFLLSKIREERQGDRVSWMDRFNSLQMIKLAWQPVGALAIVMALLLGGSGVIAAEAQKANPGDSLFVVKRVIEKTVALTKVNVTNRTIFAGRLLDTRVGELKRIAEKESQLVSGDGNANTKSVVLAVAEVRKQVDDVEQNFQKMKGAEKKSEKDLAMAALDLNKKIRKYYKELRAVNQQVEDKTVSKEINKTLVKVEDISSQVLEVMIDKHEKGIEGVEAEEIETSLAMHMEQIKDRVAGIESIVDKDEEVTKKTEEIKTRIAEAEVALEDDKYALFLTLANDSNKILELLYGELEQTETQGEVKGESDINEEGGVEVDKVQESDVKDIEVVNKKEETEEVEVVDETINKSSERKAVEIIDKQISPNEIIDEQADSKNITDEQSDSVEDTTGTVRAEFGVSIQ